MPHPRGRPAATVATVLCRRLEGRSRSCTLCRAGIRFAAGAHGEVQGGAVLVHLAAVCAGRCLGRPGDSEIAHGFARGKWQSVGLGRLFSGCRLLPRLLHPCVELRPGLSASLPAIGADFARFGAGSLNGRARPRDLSAVRFPTVPRRITMGTPLPMGSWAAS